MTMNPYRRCAEYVFELHIKNRPHTGAIDSLKTAYDQFCKWSKQDDGTERIVKAASDFHAFMKRSCGTTADFPLRLRIDNEADALKLLALVQELDDALKERKEQNPA